MIQRTRAQDQFGKHSKAYAKSSALSNQENLRRIIELTAPSKNDRLLDVATGTGFLAFEFAKHVCEVVGIDFTDEMLAIAKQYKIDEAVENVIFETEDMESIPFAVSSFDIVSCTFAFHHFLNPEIAISEMLKVLRPGGKIVISDIVSPEDIAKSDYQNEMERLRNPSHVKHYPSFEILQILQNHGFDILISKYWPIDFGFEEWISMSLQDAESVKRVKEMMLAAMEYELTDLNIRLRNDNIWFTYNIKIIVGRKN
ncbi:MAG: methyltransferase domain-containing protein [Methanosarcinaceae archaeon]|nr:methyltransferase domain-containing protein [Methanosarcinaceae archaeon]